MRKLLPTLAMLNVCSCVLAADCGNDPAPEQITKAVVDALGQKKIGDKPIVANAETAQAIHSAVASAAYGKNEVERQRPLRAVRSGDFWVVYGCIPRNTFGGVAVSVIRASNGEVISITHGQ